VVEDEVREDEQIEFGIPRQLLKQRPDGVAPYIALGFISRNSQGSMSDLLVRLLASHGLVEGLTRRCATCSRQGSDQGSR
jgi:hypothetical protein